jgi:hypothetical protein
MDSWHALDAQGRVGLSILALEHLEHPSWCRGAVMIRGVERRSYGLVKLMIRELRRVSNSE